MKPVTVTWPSRADVERPRADLDRVPVETLRLWRALAVLRPPGGADAPAWARSFLDYVPAPDDAPVARERAPRTDPLAALWDTPDAAAFEAALAAAWPDVHGATDRAALREIATALGVAVPADPAPPAPDPVVEPDPDPVIDAADEAATVIEATADASDDDPPPPRPRFTIPGSIAVGVDAARAYAHRIMPTIPIRHRY